MKTLQNSVLQLVLFAVLIACVAVLYAAGSGKQLPVTGQTTEYTAHDDGSYRTGTDAPSMRFLDNGDGTLTDNMTALVWLQNPDSTTRTWAEAIAYCDDLEFGGYTDWRLPSINELETLIIFSDSEDTCDWLNRQGFSNVQSSVYWTSTTLALNASSRAWVVGMRGFSFIAVDNNKTNFRYVLPVRSGN